MKWVALIAPILVMALRFWIKWFLYDDQRPAAQERRHRDAVARVVAMGHPIPPPPPTPEQEAAEQLRREAAIEAEVQRIVREEQHRDT